MTNRLGNDKSKIMVGIPAYNCEKQIARVLGQFDQIVLPFIVEVIVVDNRSSDRTRDVAADGIASLRGVSASVLMNAENQGYGGTMKVIFNYALQHGYDYLIILHGDDQADIRDLVPYFQSREYENYDCFLGARFMQGSRLKGYSTFRTFGNSIFNWLFSLVLRKWVYDLGSGLNMYRVSIFRNGYFIKFPEDLTFDYCGLMAHSFYERRIKFFPISWREEDQVSNVRIVRQAVKSLKLLFSFFVARKGFMEHDWRCKVRDLDAYSVVSTRQA